ncbi:MAG: hypothetical protein KBT33_05640 [Prevotellaceae bacterium]|nr:hypothetical protein [Candidatus Minthosoma equi]
MEKEKKYHELRYAVELTLGRQMKTFGDFSLLEKAIMERQHEHISSTTLRRFWGYQSDQTSEMREASLSVLARFVGYVNWQAFVLSEGGNAESVRFDSRRLSVSELNRGDEIRLLWKPDREVVVRFEGLDLFTVVSSVNSKLQAGNTFHCNLFLEDMPLMLTCLLQGDMPPTNYICGRQNGVKFFKI